MHREHVELRIVAAHFQIVALVAGGGRQHDVGMLGGGGPVRLVDHDGVRPLPGFDQVIGVLMLVEGVAARHIHHFHLGVSDLGTVEVDGFARVAQAFGDARHRDRRRGVLRRVAGGDAGDDAALGGRAAAGGIVIAEAEAAARQADLAEHRRHRHQQPVLLFAVVLALNAPAAHDHGAMLRHLARQTAQRVGIDAADVGRPFGGFRHAVALAQQVGLELVEADGVGFQEVRVMQLLGQQRVGDADQHGAVGIRTRGDPLRIDELGAVVVHRIDADHPGAFLLQRLEAGLADVIRHVPAVFSVTIGLQPHRITSSLFSITFGQAVCCS